MSSGRYYVQYQPDQAGREALLRVQADLLKSGEGRPVPADELHLTIIHFGIFTEVLADVRRYKADVEERSFADGLQLFIKRCMDSAASEGAFTPAAIGRLGSHGSVVVLEGGVDAALATTHATCLEHLKAMLGGVLDSDPLPFMEQSPNFKHALTLRPHISLIRSERSEFRQELRRELPALVLHRMSLTY